MRVILFQNVFVVFRRQTTEEDRHLSRIHVLAETLVLPADLKSQFTRVTQDDHRDLDKQRLNEIIDLVQVLLVRRLVRVVEASPGRTPLFYPYPISLDRRYLCRE